MEVTQTLKLPIRVPSVVSTLFQDLEHRIVYIKLKNLKTKNKVEITRTITSSEEITEHVYATDVETQHIKSVCVHLTLIQNVVTTLYCETILTQPLVHSKHSSI